MNSQTLFDDTMKIGWFGWYDVKETKSIDHETKNLNSEKFINQSIKSPQDSDWPDCDGLDSRICCLMCYVIIEA